LLEDYSKGDGCFYILSSLKDVFFDEEL